MCIHIEPFYNSWALFNFELIDWSQLPQQSFRLLGMFLVVAFSSSLDVAAIEMEIGLPLDYNRELNTVGLANVFSGLLGGYTGSYIFSQTIFTMRRGVYSRINGYMIVLCEALMILVPISILSYLPKLFFGSLLVLISTDLMMEWLVAARKKMAWMEYVVCLLTFLAIQAYGIEVGKIGLFVSFSNGSRLKCLILILLFFIHKMTRYVHWNSWRNDVFRCELFPPANSIFSGTADVLCNPHLRRASDSYRQQGKSSHYHSERLYFLRLCCQDFGGCKITRVDCRTGDDPAGADAAAGTAAASTGSSSSRRE
jgi:hypothetical protein